jgi:hypothetical protein
MEGQSRGVGARIALAKYRWEPDPSGDSGVISGSLGPLRAVFRRMAPAQAEM